jgi:hypothetical protein
MTQYDEHDEVEVIKPVDIDDAMLALDIALACDADRHAWANGSLWGRADLLVDADGTVRLA